MPSPRGRVAQPKAAAPEPAPTARAPMAESRRADPSVSQRRDELGQLIECLKQELTKRMQALEEMQTDFYEARHERGLLFAALQRVERICVQMCKADPTDSLAGDLVDIVAEVPERWMPVDDDSDFVERTSDEESMNGRRASSASMQ